MAPIPPIEVSNVARGNTTQGCCARVEAADNAHVVFSSETKEFKSKTRTFSFFNNIRCCVFETREQKEERWKDENIDTHNGIREYLKEYKQPSWEEVKRELHLELEEADPITESTVEKINEYIRNRNKPSLEEHPDDATSRIMSAATFQENEEAVHPAEKKTSRSASRISSKNSKESNPSPVEKAVERNGIFKHKKRDNVKKTKSTSVVPRVANWESIEVAGLQSDTLEQSITRRFIQEVAKHYSDEQIGPLDVERVLRDFQDFVEKEKLERALYEEKMKKIEILVEAVREKMMGRPGSNPPLSHRTMREIIRNVLEADEELEAMYQEVRGQTPAHPEEEWLDHTIEDASIVSDRLREHLGYSRSASDEHETRVKVAQKVTKKMSGKLHGVKGPVTPERVLKALEDAAEDTPPERSKKEEAIELVVDE